MTERKLANVAASVRQRLLNRARVQKRSFQELATLYAMERFLFRLGRSPHADGFVLKGGLMTLTWAGEHARVTRDIDLLGRGANSVTAVVVRIREVLAVDVDDGIRFDPASVNGSELRTAAAYTGVRVSFRADLAGMLLHLQVDVGFGDVVVPEPRWTDYPQLLDFGAPRLLGYPPEATLAEKLHAIVVLGYANTRMKDYYDLWTAHRLAITTSESLGAAVRQTFARRGTVVPDQLPEALSPAFAGAPEKQAQWAGFVRKSALDAPEFHAVVEAAAELAGPAFVHARQA